MVINEIFLMAMTISLISIITSSAVGQLLIEDNEVVQSEIRDVSQIEEMPKGIPIGEYSITSNGLHGEMNITSFDSKGHFSGPFSNI
jgi:hypothetical protein